MPPGWLPRPGPEPATAMANSAASAAPLLICGNCRAPMRRVVLPAHYTGQVELDLCDGCNLLWFDGTECVRLPGSSLLGLIDEMARAQGLPFHVLRRDAGCARCRAPLKTVHNTSRWGRSLQLECRSGHGAYQSFAQYLAGKGLVRSMSLVDRAALLARDGRIDCVDCGAAIGQHDEHCPQCQAVPALLDVARLAHALDPEGGTRDHAVHNTPGQRGALECPACGAATPAAQPVACPQCGATLSITRLADVARTVGALADALRRHESKPSPEIVARRLKANDGNLERQREWARDMEREAQQRRGHGGFERGDDQPAVQQARVAALVLLGALCALAWWWRG
jgi:hypothetical protein